ncbi:MAG: hypothetical protein J5486_02145 [Bacteroidaceae bacterium]|nr:hypothetical protein [Bacteroidaceae bacterium]
MNKQYIKPAIQIEYILDQLPILSSSIVTSVSSNADIEYGEGGSSESRVKSDDEWDIGWN